MRQQRDFFRFFAHTEEQVVIKPPEAEPSSLFHSELIFSSNQPLHSSFYLHQTMEGRYAERGIQDLPNLHSTNLLMHNTQFSHFDESDVDTSLHL
ncbi:hypothetical protein LINGRAPRIM_LOCUS235 [Linum grandiflorum]